MKISIAFCLFLAFYSASSLPLEELEGRITNGQIARRGQFPYQAGLQIAKGLKKAWCGATIISERWLVTAAHCAVQVDSVTVYLGAFDINDDNEKGQQRIYCSKSNIFVHEGYNPSVSMAHDIALIKLPVPIEFNELIQPATLPKKSENYSTYEGEMVVASGWGKEKDNATSVSQYLRYVEVPIMKQSSCNNYYLNSITDGMICIKTPDKKSTCNGDSGGPLVHKEGDEHYVIGATSFGIIFGCEKGWPGVFTRMTSYIDWIEKISGVVNKQIKTN